MFTLPKLAYDLTALEPVISGRTMELHYNKHHKAYIDNLNKLIIGTELENMSLEEIIIKTTGQLDKQGIFNNAGQHFNHHFFWQALCPVMENSNPSQAVVEALNKDFGSLEKFKEEFISAAGSLFGSGWVWLVKEAGQLKIVKMFNADNPIAHGFKPVFALDVWEHSYYLDYQNRRLDFVSAVLDKTVNWEFVAKNILL